ncbi:hypothetical protein [Streptomyces wedmorensis]
MPRPSGAVEAVHLPVDEPLFTALAAPWTATGRVVPGAEDRKWTMLADGPS